MEIEFKLQRQFNGFFGQPVAINWNIQFSGQACETLNVISVLVRDEDSSEVLDRAPHREEALANLAPAQAGVDEQTRLLSFDISAVAAGPAAQNRDLHSHVPAD